MPADSQGAERGPIANAPLRPPSVRLAPLLVVLSVAVVMMALVYERGLIPWNSDMAIVGLMAQDILHRGAHPVFFDGSEYAGALEQYYLALVFSVCPESVTTHRAAIAVLLLLLIGLVWLFARLAFGNRAALAAALYLALGPPFFYYRGLTSEGPYTPIYLIGAAILFLLLRIESRSRSGHTAIPEILALGFLGGLGWWTHPMVLVFAGCALAALLLGEARRRLTAWTIVGSLSAAALGASPWILRNMDSGWASLVGPELARATPFHVREQLGLLFRAGLPILMGGRSIWAMAPVFPGSAAIAYAVLAVLIGFGVWMWASNRTAVQGYAAGILLPLLIITPALALAASRADFREPRLLFPLYLAIAPLFGAALVSRGVTRWLKAGMCFVVLVLHAVAYGDAPRFDPPPYDLVRALRDRYVHAVYASYWTAYRLTFLSGGAVVGTPFGTSNLARRPGDHREVDGSPSPAYLLDPEEAGRFEAFLNVRTFAHRREQLGKFVLFSQLSPAALGQLRSCECIPSSSRRVTWLGVDGPHRLASGSVARFRARLRNDSAEEWSPGMNLSYRWVTKDGKVVVLDGLRTPIVHPPRPGETVETDVTVEVNVPPGRYTLVIDVVEEGVAWFADRGVQPPTWDCEVF